MKLDVDFEPPVLAFIGKGIKDYIKTVEGYAEEYAEDSEYWRNEAEKFRRVLREIDQYVEEYDTTIWRFVKNQDYVPLPCPKCGGDNTVGWGYRKNRYETVPIRRCKDCNAGYVNKSTFFKMKNRREIIEVTQKLVGDGLSLRDTADYVSKNYGVKISATTVLNWTNPKRMPRALQTKPELKLFCGSR